MHYSCGVKGAKTNHKRIVGPRGENTDERGG